MRIVLFSVLVLLGLATVVVWGTVIAAVIPSGSPAAVIGPSTFTGPAASPAEDVKYEPPADVIDRERLLAADVNWASCYLEYRGDPFMLEGCELGWYMHTEYFEHDYDIEPPWERD